MKKNHITALMLLFAGILLSSSKYVPQYAPVAWIMGAILVLVGLGFAISACIDHTVKTTKINQ
jgi:hypothetical protein